MKAKQANRFYKRQNAVIVVPESRQFEFYGNVTFDPHRIQHVSLISHQLHVFPDRESFGSAEGQHFL